MHLTSRFQRPLAVAALAVITLTSVASLADARSRHRRFRGPVVVERRIVRPVYRPVRVYHRAPYARYTVWRSERGPVIAGFLGGLYLGATLANAAPHGFVYWDAYCHRGFATLELYQAHCRRRAHEHVIQVVEAPYGYDRSDLHFCDQCDEEYWGDEHECDD